MSMGATRRTARRDEQGQATLEIIGSIPLFMLVLGVIIQLFMIGYAAIGAESAARMAAREASNGVAASTASAHSIADAPGIFRPQVAVADPGDLVSSGEEPSVAAADVPAGAISARATFTVPFLGIGVPGLNLKVTRFAVVPRTD